VTVNITSKNTDSAVLKILRKILR